MVKRGSSITHSFVKAVFSISCWSSELIELVRNARRARRRHREHLSAETWRAYLEALDTTAEAIRKVKDAP
jgi:hypothetical protein